LGGDPRHPVRDDRHSHEPSRRDEDSGGKTRADGDPARGALAAREGEEEHANWIEAQLTLIAQLGEANYLAQQIKEGAE